MAICSDIDGWSCDTAIFLDIQCRYMYAYNVHAFMKKVLN